MAELDTFRIVTLPKPRDRTNPDTTTIAMAEKLRNLRLQSLHVAPDAFASTFEDESKCGLDMTLDRMTNPKAVQFVAIKKSPGTGPTFDNSNDIDKFLKDQWLGLIVLLGPVEDNPDEGAPKRDPFARMTAADREVAYLDSGGLESRASALHYHLNGMFVDLSARGGGLAKALVNAALQSAEAAASQANAAMRVTIIVYKHNVAARALYEKIGFKVVGERPSLTLDDGSIAVDMELSMAADP